MDAEGKAHALAADTSALMRGERRDDLICLARISKLAAHTGTRTESLAAIAQDFLQLSEYGVLSSVAVNGTAFHVPIAALVSILHLT